MSVTKYVVDSDKKFSQAIKDALEQVDDLTIPFTLIAKSWFKSNKAIFALKGPGKYQDLSPKYKKQKQKSVGFVYPILRRSGVLEESVTNPASPNSINLILNKNTLVLGTKVPYGAYHQFGTSKLPARPFVLIGAEQVSPPELNRRVDAWIEIVKDYVLQASRSAGTLS